MAPDDPRTNVPAPLSSRPIDRAMLERVLRRASELQAGTSEPETERELTEAQLLEIGREVGLSPEHLRQALAEERTRVVLPTESTTVGRMVGPARAIASRTVRGSPERVLAILDGWMQRDECLQLKRRYLDRVVWEARRDLIGNAKRLFRIGGRGYELTRAHDVAATAVAVDETRSLVRLEADLSPIRTSHVRMGALTAGAGVVAGGSVLTAGLVAGAMLAPVIAVAALPVIVAGGMGYGVVHGYARTARRVQLALEQLLDRLEFDGGEQRPPSLLQLLSR